MFCESNPKPRNPFSRENMGTVIFHPCYSFPSFSTSSQCSKQPKLKLRASIFFKGIADGWSREAFPRFPRLKVSSKILDIRGDGRTHEGSRVRPPKKKILRNKTPIIRDNEMSALVKQVQSSLRKEKVDQVISQETAVSPSKRSLASGGGSSESKSPAAEFWENHLRLRNQALAEKPPAKEENGALPKKNQTVADTKTKPAQKKKNQIIAAETKASHIPETPQPIVVDLKSTRPRSNFTKRSPISSLPLEKLLSGEASLPVIAAKTKKTELSGKPLPAVAAKTEKPELSSKQPKMSSKPLPVVAAKIEKPEPSSKKPELSSKQPKTNNKPLPVVAAKTEKPELSSKQHKMSSKLLSIIASETEKHELSSKQPKLSSKQSKTSSKPLPVVAAAKTKKPEPSSKSLQVVAARTEEPEEKPALGKMQLPELSSEALPVVAAITEAPSLDVMTNTELKRLAKSRGIKGFSRMKREELMESLVSLE